MNSPLIALLRPNFLTPAVGSRTACFLSSEADDSVQRESTEDGRREQAFSVMELNSLDFLKFGRMFWLRSSPMNRPLNRHWQSVVTVSGLNLHNHSQYQGEELVNFPQLGLLRQENSIHLTMHGRESWFHFISSLQRKYFRLWIDLLFLQNLLLGCSSLLTLQVFHLFPACSAMVKIRLFDENLLCVFYTKYA